MSDACGCSDDETTPGGEEAEEHEAERLRSVWSPGGPAPLFRAGGCLPSPWS